jgi:prophage maintenance system killer protein
MKRWNGGTFAARALKLNSHPMSLWASVGAVRLNEVFESGIHALQREVSNPFERATAFFLFGSLQQFFIDGNKRTSRFMMNGVLMTAGIDAVSIPAVRAAEFNSRMVDFYMNRNATEMMSFVLDCHPEAAQIRQLNPNVSAVHDSPGIKYYKLGESAEQTNQNDALDIDSER